MPPFSHQTLAALPLIQRFGFSDDLFDVLSAELAALRAAPAAHSAVERAEKAADNEAKGLADCFLNISAARQEEKKLRAGPDAEKAASAVHSLRTLELTAKAKTLATAAADTAVTSAVESAKAADAQLVVCEQAATETLARLYRRQTIKLHPDQNGEHLRACFEALVSSAKVLRERALRHSYLREMADVYEADASLVPMADEAWFERHAPGAGERAARSGPAGSAAGRLTEGGIGQMPKAPWLAYHWTLPAETVVGRGWVEAEHMHSVVVELMLPPQPHSYAQYSARVQLLEHAYSKTAREFVVPILPASWAAGHVQVALQLLGFDSGHAHTVRWCIEFGDLDGSERPRSPWSMALRLTHADPRIVLLAVERERAAATIRRHTAALTRAAQAANKTFSAADGSVAFATKARDCAHDLHKVHVRVSGAVQRLKALLDEGAHAHEHARMQPSAQALTELWTLVRDGLAATRDAAQAAQLLEPWIERARRLDCSRAFTHFLARKLEAGEFAQWILTRGESGPSEPALEAEGGNVNRLYQLLVEGPRALPASAGDAERDAASSSTHALEVDSFALQCASQRDDLFSAKQRKRLAEASEHLDVAERRAEVEAGLADARRAKEEATKRAEAAAAKERAAATQASDVAAPDSERAAQNDARMRVYQSGIKLGGLVSLVGLSAAANRNNQLAVCTSVDDEFARKGRVVVRVAVGVNGNGEPIASVAAGSELAVRIENVLVLDGAHLDAAIAKLRSGAVPAVGAAGPKNDAKPAALPAHPAAQPTAAPSVAAPAPTRGSTARAGESRAPPAAAAAAPAVVPAPAQPRFPRTKAEQMRMTRCHFFDKPQGCHHAKCPYSHDPNASRHPQRIVKGEQPSDELSNGWLSPEPQLPAAENGWSASAIDAQPHQPPQSAAAAKRDAKKVLQAATKTAARAAVRAEPAHAEPAPDALAPVPPPSSPWVREFDPSSDSYYYWSRITRITTWDVPTELLPAVAAAAASTPPATQPSKAQARAAATHHDEDVRLCVVCIERPKSHAFDRCFHKCVCAHCADVIRTRPKAQWLCPICRTQATAIRQVFE